MKPICENCGKLGNACVCEQLRIKKAVAAAVREALAQQRELHAIALNVLERHHKAEVEQLKKHLNERCPHLMTAIDDWNSELLIKKEGVPSESKKGHCSLCDEVERLKKDMEAMGDIHLAACSKINKMWRKRNDEFMAEFERLRRILEALINTFTYNGVDYNSQIGFDRMQSFKEAVKPQAKPDA